MSDVVQKYYEKLMDLMFSSGGKISVPTNFHGQMRVIEKLLKNDNTALISTILEFMIHSATVSYSFDAQNDNVNKALSTWAKDVNKDLNLDIPKGLRNFTEQFMRERLKSSMNVVRLKWNQVDGYWLPTRMWLMDGASIYVKNDKKALNTNQYFLGKPGENNIISNSENETILIRKPYNQWYDSYPTPYLVKKGALYHALFKQKILARIAEVVNTAFPYQFFIKMGTEQAINQGKAPSEEALREQLKAFQTKNSEAGDHQFAKGLGGAFPADVKFEELIPSYEKVLNDKILAPTDKNILSALGMIELKGFAQNREEMILNPKVLVEEVSDCVADYTDFLEDVMDLIKERNSTKYNFSGTIDVAPGVIESFVTDDMRTLIRSMYDRGLVSMEDTLEGTTSLNFKTQVKKRKQETARKIDLLMEPRKIQNMDGDTQPEKKNDNEEEVTPDKDKKTPEADNYKNADLELITEPMKTVRSIPEDIKKQLTKAEQQTFKVAFNEALANGKNLEYDNFLLEKTAMEFAVKKVFKK
ncbi:MAG: hypothetical protein ACTSWD_02425 [Candidatus Heimdallarchaeota archaeon]